MAKQHGTTDGNYKPDIEQKLDVSENTQFWKQFEVYLVHSMAREIRCRQTGLFKKILVYSQSYLSVTTYLSEKKREAI
jgi:hypothetical protein